MTQSKPANAVRLGPDGGDAVQIISRPDVEAVDEG
jgi:hypothetical protein